MDETAVVTVFLRRESEVLLLRRSDDVGSYPGQWGAVAGHAEGEPDVAARREIAEETGLDPEAAVTLVRRGEPFEVEDTHLETQWLVHPSLFDADEEDIEPNWETAAWEWVPPTAILRRETVPDLWTSYDRVRPTVETVAADREHGSAWLSVRALEVLRDVAALGTTDRADTSSPGGLHETALALVAARPAMPVVRNRVDRVMAGAGGRGPEAAEQATSYPPDPGAVERAAVVGIERAHRVDDEAASSAAERVDGRRVATLSRSGTVKTALSTADPEALLVAESRPGGGGVPVAEALAADGHEVTLTSDAAVAAELARWAADVLLLGADAILPDGHVVNKVGTRAAAVAAAHEGIDVVVAASTDKVDSAVSKPEAVDREDGGLGPLYQGEAAIDVVNPTFDVTPPELVDAIVTEEGPLEPAAIQAVAAAHRDRAAWRRED